MDSFLNGTIFSTLTNVNFDDRRMYEELIEGEKLRVRGLGLWAEGEGSDEGKGTELRVTGQVKSPHCPCPPELAD